MANVITPNPVPSLGDQSGSPRNALYIRRTRILVLTPTASGVVTGEPSWGGGFTMPICYYGLNYENDWVMENVFTPVTFLVVVNSLPPGLSLAAVGQAGGKITGIATQLGTFSFTLRAINAVGSADQAFSINVVPVPVSGFV